VCECKRSLLGYGRQSEGYRQARGGGPEGGRGHVLRELFLLVRVRKKKEQGCGRGKASGWTWVGDAGPSRGSAAGSGGCAP